MLPALTARQAILGVPLDPNKQPSGSGLVRAIEQMDARVIGNNAGAIIRNSLTALNSTTSPAVGLLAWVMGDATVANNGVYENTGTSGSPTWTRRGPLPYGYIYAVNVGAGAADAIEVTTSIPIPVEDGAAEITVPIVTPNTSTTVTLSINGETALPVKTQSGNDPAVGGLTGFIKVIKLNSTYRMLTDQVSAAIVAQAEAAAERAESSLIELKTIFLGAYPSDAEATAANPDRPVGARFYHTTLGRDRVWTGSRYKSVPRIQEIDLADYDLVADDPASDNGPAIQAAIDEAYAAGVNFIIKAPPGRYYVHTLSTKESAAELSVGLVGCGKGVTTFVVDGDEGCRGLLNLYHTDKNSSCVFRDFSVEVKGVVAGTGTAVGDIANGTVLAFRVPYIGVIHNQSASCENVDIFPIESDAVHYARVGIDLSGTWFPTVRNIWVAGPWGFTPGFNDDYSDTAHKYKMEVGLLMDDCYQPVIGDNVLLESCHTGFRSWSLNDPGVVGTNAEGIDVSGIKAVNVRRGIDIQRHDDQREPEFYVRGTHINARDYGIYASGLEFFGLGEDVMFFNEDTAGAAAGRNYTDVYLRNVDRGTVSGQFGYAGNADRINIDIDGGLYAEGVHVTKCNFGSSGANNRALRVRGANAKYIYASGNVVMQVGYAEIYVDETPNGALTVDDFEQGQAGLGEGGDRILRRWRNTGDISPGDHLDTISNAAGAGDGLGQRTWRGSNAAGTLKEWIAQNGLIVDATAGSEDARLDTNILINGSEEIAQQLSPPANHETAMSLLRRSGAGALVLDRVRPGSPDRDDRNILLVGTPPAGFPLVGYRPRLIGPLSLYVRQDGNNANGGYTNTAGGAFLTIQAAVDKALDFDNGGFDITIRVAAGTYDESVVVEQATGGGYIVITSGSGIAGDVHIAPATGTAVTARDGARLSVQTVKLTSADASALLAYGIGTQLLYGDILFSGAASGNVDILYGARAEENVNCVWDGAAGYMYLVRNRSMLQIGGRTLFINSSPALTNNFAFVNEQSTLYAGGWARSGDIAAGAASKYFVGTLSQLSSSGASANFPGGAGSVDAATYGVAS